MTYEKNNERKEVMHKLEDVGLSRLPPNSRWRVVGHHKGTKEYVWTTGNTNDLLAIDIVVKRIPTSQILRAIIPLCIITMGSSLSFWIAPAAVPARVGFGVTMLLVGVAQQQSLSKDMPPVNYLTFMDVLALQCIVYLSSVLIIYAMVHYKAQDKATAADAVALDQRARIWHPVSFIAIFTCGIVTVMVANNENAPMQEIVPK